MNNEEMEKRILALEARLQRTEDIQAIHAIQRKYINALICTEWDACADTFSKNARVDVYLHDPIQGQDAIRKWFKEDLAKTHAGKEGDILVHPEITLDGDTAKGKWLLYMQYAYPRTGQALFWVQGYYENEYVREDGEWKISLMSWSERMGLPGGGPPEGLW